MKKCYVIILACIMSQSMQGAQVVACTQIKSQQQLDYDLKQALLRNRQALSDAWLLSRTKLGHNFPNKEINDALQRGANPNIYMDDGTPAFQYALKSGSSLYTLAAFLEKKLDLDAVDNKGDTALINCIGYNNYYLAAILIFLGARTDIKNKDGLSYSNYFNSFHLDFHTNVAEVSKLLNCLFKGKPNGIGGMDGRERVQEWAISEAIYADFKPDNYHHQLCQSVTSLHKLYHEKIDENELKTDNKTDN